MNRFFQRFSQMPDDWQSPVADMYRQQAAQQPMNQQYMDLGFVNTVQPVSRKPLGAQMPPGYGNRYGIPQPPSPPTPLVQYSPQPQPNQPIPGNNSPMRPFNIQPGQLGGALGNVPAAPQPAISQFNPKPPVVTTGGSLGNVATGGSPKPQSTGQQIQQYLGR